MKLTYEEAKKELEEYPRIIFNIMDITKEIERFENMKEGLKAVNIDGMPKGNSKKNENLEEAIIKMDETIDKLNRSMKKDLRKAEKISNKMNKLKFPEQKVIKLFYKHNKSIAEIAVDMKRTYKQTQRYIKQGIEIYQEI